MKEKPTLTELEAWGFNALMVTAAFRYCLGRQTYIVSVCADWLVANWDRFPQNVRDVIQRDLEEEFERDDAARREGNSLCKPLGWDCDRKEWERVRALWQSVAISCNQSETVRSQKEEPPCSP